MKPPSVTGPPAVSEGTGARRPNDVVLPAVSIDVAEGGHLGARVQARLRPSNGGAAPATRHVNQVRAAAVGLVGRGANPKPATSAIVQLAADRDDLGPDLRPWFKEFAASL